MKSLKRVFALFLVLSIMLGNLNLSAGFAAESSSSKNNPVTKLNKTPQGEDIPVSDLNDPSKEDIAGIKDQDELQIPKSPNSDFSKPEANANNTENAVSDVLADISVTRNVYGDKP